MKLLITIGYFAWATSSPAEEMLSFLTGKIDGVEHTYEYPLSKVQVLPEWDTRGETPISFKDALKKAWEFAKKQQPDGKILLDDVDLDARGYPVGSPPTKKRVCWVYRFDFVSLVTGRDLPTAVVLMDGTVLEPKPKLKIGEQGAAGQPATRPVLKPEGSQKPQTKSEERTR